MPKHSHKVTLVTGNLLCMDSEGAASQVPVKMQKCDKTKKSQLFSLPTNGNLFHIALLASPGTCLEDWYPGA